MGKKSGAGMIIPDHISESLSKNVLDSKYLNSLMRMRIRDLFDPGSGIPDLFDPGSGIADEKVRSWDKHPGSATLLTIKDTMCLANSCEISQLPDL
jgi:hypothetical protein